MEPFTEEHVRAWAAEAAAIGERIGRHFHRSEPRDRVVGYIRELLSDAKRKNGWQLAEKLGEETPYAIQHLLARAAWSADKVRDELTRYIVETLGDAGGVLIVDEAAFVKNGKRSAGVSEQHCRETGTIENCQVGLFLGYVSNHGAALVDRALYLPDEWIADRDRCRRAGVPDDVQATTKVDLAREMIARAVAARLPVKWATADEVYGSDYHFRLALESHRLGYVVRVPPTMSWNVGRTRVRVDSLPGTLTREAWHERRGRDDGSEHRFCDWAVLAADSSDPEASIRGLLFRRDAADPSNVAYFACGGPSGTSLEEWVEVAEKHNQMERCFQTARTICGLDGYEVRKWAAWHRHVTLSMFALAAIAALRCRGLNFS